MLYDKRDVTEDAGFSADMFGLPYFKYFAQGEKAMLIQYNRPDQEGPKLSDFHIASVDDVEAMKVYDLNLV